MKIKTIGIDPNTPRTWRLYCDHEVRYFSFGDTHEVTFSSRKEGEDDGRLTCKTNHAKVLETVGSLVDLDVTPDLGTFQALWAVQREWEERGYSSDKYTPGVPGYDVRSVITNVFQDIGSDVPGDIFRWFLTEEIFTSTQRPGDRNTEGCPFTGLTTMMVGHPSIPHDVIDSIVKLRKKDDPTTPTNGGRLYTFLIRNPNLTEDHLVGIVKNASRVEDLRSCILHPNSTQRVMSLVFHKTKSDVLKNDVLRCMYDRGLIQV